MSSRRHTIEYDAEFGNLRNRQGMRLYEEMMAGTSPEVTTQKKHYKAGKGQISKFGMLNEGTIWLPRVDDPILNVSDIQGARVGTIQSDAVRNRLVARKLRESRLGKVRPDLQCHRNSIQEMPTAFRVVPRMSSHLARASTMDIESLKGDQISSEKLKTAPSAFQYATQTGKRQQERSAGTQNPQTATQTLADCPMDVCRKQQHQSNRIQPTYTEQLNSLEDRVLMSPYQKLISVPSKNWLEASKNCMDRPKSKSHVPHRLARLNPTFLSYGSQYLYNSDNYLASYGKSLLY